MHCPQMTGGALIVSVSWNPRHALDANCYQDVVSHVVVSDKAHKHLSCINVAGLYGRCAARAVAVFEAQDLAADLDARRRQPVDGAQWDAVVAPAQSLAAMGVMSMRAQACGAAAYALRVYIIDRLYSFGPRKWNLERQVAAKTSMRKARYAH